MNYRAGLGLLFSCAVCVACSEHPGKPAAASSAIAAEEREVAIQADGLTLHGTLSLPARTVGRPVPGLVLVGGSGPVDRDESVSGQLGMSFGFRMPSFRLLAAGLSASGIAVLRYDKRSCGRFNACAENDYPVPALNLTVAAFESDALSAIDYLERLPDVDPRRVSVLGHSEGGAFVIPILTQRSDVRSGVMVSAPFKPLDQVLSDQTDFLRSLLEQAGATPARIEQQLAPLEQAEQALAAIRSGSYSGGPILGAGQPYWASLLALGDQNPTLAQELARPVLALGGSYDWNVPPTELTAWAASFATSANAARYETRLLPCMTHALNCVTQADLSKLSASDIGRDLQAELTPAIAQFINSH